MLSAYPPTCWIALVTVWFVMFKNGNSLRGIRENFGTKKSLWSRLKWILIAVDLGEFTCPLAGKPQGFFYFQGSGILKKTFICHWYKGGDNHPQRTAGTPKIVCVSFFWGCNLAWLVWTYAANFEQRYQEHICRVFLVDPVGASSQDL